MMLREDNLGLGAQLGKGNAETFGLSLFSGVLSRLNGGSDADVEKKQSAIRDAELSTYHAKKHGFMNFVSGGVLVGDTIKDREEVKGKTSKQVGAVVGDAVDDSLRRKRKAGEDAQPEEPVRRKRSKKQDLSITTVNANDHGSVPSHISPAPLIAASFEHSANTEPPEQISANDEHDAENPSAPASSLRKHRKSRGQHDDTTTQPHLTNLSDKARAKEEKRARKEERRKRKEEKRRLKAAREESGSARSNATPPVTVSAVSRLPQAAAPINRHAVRRRYIEQKRMSAMDPQAMKEIFMLTAKV